MPRVKCLVSTNGQNQVIKAHSTLNNKINEEHTLINNEQLQRMS